MHRHQRGQVIRKSVHSICQKVLFLSFCMFLLWSTCFGCADSTSDVIPAASQGDPTTSTPGSIRSLPPTWTFTPLVSATLRPTFTPQPSRTPAPTLVLHAMIEGIQGQPMQISLDCEANSAVVFAGFFGVKINELSFFMALPVSDNPHKGFVGDVHGEWGHLPPDSYGIYPGPVADELQQRGVNAVAVYQFTLDGIKREIASGEPVIVWVIGHVEHGKAQSYTSSDGLTSIVAPHEHTVLVIGYDQTTITVLDSDKIYTRSIADFLSSWGVLGNMAIIKF